MTTPTSQADAPAGPGANPPTGDDTDQTPDSNQDNGDSGDHGDGKDRGEAKLRKRAQAAEQRVTELEEQLTNTRQHIIDRAVTDEGYKPGLLRAAGIDMADLLDDDGMPDTGKITAAITQAADDIGATRQPRPPEPNQQQGRGGGPARGTTSWSKALKG